MKWYCFLFWFVYRLFLACLAHFNWVLAFFYTNCAYFWLWKSYDLLWFWMHLVLCICFPQLRRENYLLVWCNLIWKKCTVYPNLTYKQLYLALYGGKGTKAERALQRMDTVEHRERETRRLRKLSGVSSSSSDTEEEDFPTANASTKDLNGVPTTYPNLIAEEEEEEARKYVYVGQAVDSQPDLESGEVENDDPIPVAPPRRPKTLDVPSAQTATSSPTVPSVTFNVDDTGAEGDAEHSGNESDTNSTTKWLEKVPLPKILRNRFRRSDHSAVSQTSTDGSPKSNEGNGNGDTVSDISTWAKIRKVIPNPLKFNRSASQDYNPTELDILKPDFTNTYDVKDPKERVKRERRDRRALTQRVRKRLREELKQAARVERQRRMVTDSIELFLQLLRMMDSFALLVGNIRKTFIPAQFKYLRPGQHPYDDYELVLLFRATCFMDVAMFWMNVLYVYCLQWHLCCRLGFVKFWAWAAFLAVIACSVMLVPMSYAMNEMDLSWCRFLPNSTLERFQPNW